MRDAVSLRGFVDRDSGEQLTTRKKWPFEAQAEAEAEAEARSRRRCTVRGKCKSLFVTIEKYLFMLHKSSQGCVHPCI